MHKTLEHQIKRKLRNPEMIPAEFEELFESISLTYKGFDDERLLIERSLEISSRELRTVVATLQTTLDSVGEGILVVDETQKILYFNKRFVEIWEIPVSVMTTHRTEQVVSFILDKVEDPKFFKLLIEQVNDAQNDGVLNSIKLKDQKTVTISSHSQLIENKAVGRVWSFRDVTKSLHIEEEIQNKITVLERLNKTMVDRELKMIELKNKIKTLEQQIQEATIK
jgi:PAS domain-containing protein